MSIVFLLLAGLSVADLEVGDPCEQALHLLLTQEKLEILASDVLEDRILVYTLGDGEEKTAILGCRIERPGRKS